MRMSEFINGMIVVGFFTFTFGYALSYLSAEYETDYDNTSIVKYQSYQSELNAQVQEMRNQTSESKTSSALDILGDLFQSGYNTIKLTYTSYDTFNKMSNDAIEESGMQETNYFKWVIGTIVVVVIIFTILGILLKTDRL